MLLLPRVLILDLETTNLDKGSYVNKDNSLVLSCWKWLGEDRVHSHRGNEYEQQRLLEACSRADWFVGHNFKFDIGWLVRCGLDISGIKVFDTQIAEYQLAGNRSWPLDLDSVAYKYGYGSHKDEYIDLMIKEGVCPSELPQSQLKERCQTDVLRTEHVYLSQRPLLEKEGLLAVAETAFSLVPVLADIENNGMYLDEERVKDVFSRTEREYIRVNREVEEFTGGINPRSPKQVAEFLYDVLGFEELTDYHGNPQRTGADKRKTDAETIGQLRPKNKRQREFLRLKAEQSTLEAEISKALSKFKECVDNKDILYANFNQCRTRTHRLSSNGTRYGVQFQNMARKFKPLFRARNAGWNIVEVDGSQLEFRVAGHLGRDSQALDDIRNNLDVHSFTASVLTEAGQGTDRQAAKEHTFKPLYGGSSGSKAEQTYYKAFREKYTGITRTQQGWINTVLRDKCLVTETGLKFYWPDTRSTPGGYVTNSTAICNYPVQYLATGEIIPIALVYLWHAMRDSGMRGFIVNTVHDSIVAEIPDDELELFSKLAVQCFTEKTYEYLKEHYHIDFTVPLGTAIKIGPFWGEGKEVKY